MLFFFVFLLVCVVVSAAITSYVLIRSTGIIKSESKLGVIMRHLSIQSFSPPSNIDRFVDDWVGNNTFGTENTILIYTPDFFSGIIAYEYHFTKTSGTWWGWSFNRLKQLIDRFHYHGWKVVMETTAIAYWDHAAYDYIKNKHPELSFTDANGVKAANKGWEIVIDMFANFSSGDPVLNIPAGSRLLDVYTARLKQQILDGLHWDGWFGSDGWNGPCIQGYLWGNSWDDPLPPADQYYSFSLQEMSEWAHWTRVNLPFTWNQMSLDDRRIWIRNNAASNWFQCWNLRWAQMYAQIRKNAREAKPSFVMFKQIDDSADWTGWGPTNPTGMMNITMWVEEDSCDYFVVLTEGTNLDYPDSDLRSHAELGKIEAYSAGLVKSKAPQAHLIAGVQVQYCGDLIPIWVAKQEYLAEAQTYVWHNGTRYKAVDSKIVWVQYPEENFPFYFPSGVKELFQWIQAMSTLLAQDSLTPLYLGPTFVLPTRQAGSGLSLRGFNYTFAQYVDALNIRFHPEYVNRNMNSILFDVINLAGAPWSTLDGLQDVTLRSFADGSLSVIVISQDYSPHLADIWGAGSSEYIADKTFHMTPSDGSSLTSQVLAGISDPYGAWIASGYEGTTYSLTDDAWGNYLASAGFIPIINFTDQRISLGIYYNSTSARFLYARSVTMDINDIIIPRAIINRAIYWSTYCPINSSQPLLDLKVFKLADGTILVPMMNHKDMGGSSLAYQGTNLTSTLSFDALKLGLDNPSNYAMYWQGTGESVAFSSWNNIQITLQGMADTLVIRRT